MVPLKLANNKATPSGQQRHSNDDYERVRISTGLHVMDKGSFLTYWSPLVQPQLEWSESISGESL